MTDERLAELERLVAGVTPGPWRNTIRRVSQCSEVVVLGADKPDVSKVLCWMGPAAGGFTAPCYPRGGDDLIDAWFIAAARSAVPELLAEVRRLRAELAGAVAAEVRERELRAAAIHPLCGRKSAESFTERADVAGDIAAAIRAGA